jgi:hypothetical protein
VRTISLLTEIGQVSHVFSDKTGTLTSNRMVFRRLLVSDGAAVSLYGQPPPRPKMVESSIPLHAGCRAATAHHVNYADAEGAPSIWKAFEAAGLAGAAAREMGIALAVNHSVLLEEANGQAHRPCPNPGRALPSPRPRRLNVADRALHALLRAPGRPLSLVARRAGLRGRSRVRYMVEPCVATLDHAVDVVTGSSASSSARGTPSGRRRAIIL